MPLTTIYSANNIQGNMVLIGNTLGLSKASNTLTPGTLGSIGAFITMDSTSVAPGGWGANTTLDWQKSSSPAQLNVEPGSTIEKAFLFWAGDYISGALNLTTSIPNGVTLIDSLGTNYDVLPGTTALNITGEGENGFNATYYQCFTDVTTIVQNAGNGTWVCGGVPCALNPTNNAMNVAGWALQVVYTNPSFKLTNIVIQAGPNTALNGPVNATINYGGPPLKLFATIGYAEGDATLTGDRFNIAGLSVFGSNNPVANIFCSQINYPNQTLNTFGPYGTSNSNPVAGTNVIGGRQGWDVMKIPVPLTSAVSVASTDIPTTSDPGFIYSLGFVSEASQPAIVMTKAVDKATAQSGDVLTYTIVVKNSIQPAGDFVLTDTIPVGSTFVNNSVKVNGTTISGANPSNGVSLGTIPIGGTSTITFNVTVAPPYSSSKNIVNFANGEYTFSGVTLSNISNNVTTTLTNLIQLSKTLDKNFAKVGDTLTYTLQFSNFTNDTLTNAFLIDTIPNGTSFVLNSVNIDFVNKPGFITTQPGVTLPDVGPNNVTTISYKVTVTTIPTINPIPNQGFTNYDEGTIPSSSLSNTVTTTINYANFGIAGKTVDKAFANIGDILTYTVIYQNTGNVSANNVVISDTIPNDTVFQASSVIINNIPNTTTVPVGNVLIISPGSVVPNGIATLTFKVKVSTIPNPNPILNSAGSSFTYTVDPSVPNGATSGNNTNTVTTQVNNSNLGGITKFVDKIFATCGEIITYTISIPNSGNITATNVVLSDTVPSGTSFITSSILVNGSTVSGTPASIAIGSIGPGTTATVSYKVTIVC